MIRTIKGVLLRSEAEPATTPLVEQARVREAKADQARGHGAYVSASPWTNCRRGAQTSPSQVGLRQELDSFSVLDLIRVGRSVVYSHLQLGHCPLEDHPLSLRQRTSMTHRLKYFDGVVHVSSGEDWTGIHGVGGPRCRYGDRIRRTNCMGRLQHGQSGTDFLDTDTEGKAPNWTGPPA